MKKIIIAFFLLLTIGPARAQSDVQINLSNLLIYETELSYEKVLSDYVTFGGMVGYVYDFPGISYPVNYFYIGPEFRYYVAPKYGADRFFVGAYMRYKDGYHTAVFEENGQTPNGEWKYYDQMAKFEYSKLAVGFTIGSKWMAKTGFLYGGYIGVGRILYSDYSPQSDVTSHEDEFTPETYYSYTYSYSNDSEYWDFRVGFMIGYRIGRLNE